MTQYQNYRHYKLPITTNPLHFGKLILQISELNLFITQLFNNTAIITHHDELNKIKLFKNGELVLSFKDIKTGDNSFSRILGNNKFNFINNKLFSKEIISVLIIL